MAKQDLMQVCVKKCYDRYNKIIECLEKHYNKVKDTKDFEEHSNERLTSDIGLIIQYIGNLQVAVREQAEYIEKIVKVLNKV